MIPMKSRVFFIVMAVMGLQCLCAAMEPVFFAAIGKYAVSPEITLIISKGEDEPSPRFMLMRAAGGGSGQEMTVAKPGDPFLAYWDADSQTLWWATSLRIGYCDMHNRKSGTHKRTEPFHDYNKFPPRPAVFMAEIKRVLPVSE